MRYRIKDVLSGKIVTSLHDYYLGMDGYIYDKYNCLCTSLKPEMEVHPGIFVGDTIVKQSGPDWLDTYFVESVWTLEHVKSGCYESVEKIDDSYKVIGDYEI